MLLMPGDAVQCMSCCAVADAMGWEFSKVTLNSMQTCSDWSRVAPLLNHHDGQVLLHKLLLVQSAAQSVD